MYIIGISAFYHDSAACLLRNGVVVAAAQEERFTRIKHDASFPINAINYCLEFEKISITEIEIVAFYEKPFQKFDRIIDVFSRNSPRGFLSFKKAMKSWLSEKIWIPNTIQKKLNYKGKILFVPHHESHAASAFFSSPFKEAAIIVMDAAGEKISTSLSVGKGNKIELLKEQNYPHSLGLFYSAFTYYCGFKVNSGEYKLMGLAPYGEPKYVDLLKEFFINVAEDGSMTLKLENYDFEVGLRMLSKKGLAKLALPVSVNEHDIGQYYKDIAASVQSITEEAVLKTVEYAVQETGLSNITLAGGVALNCKANGELANRFPDLEIWIQPAAGDAGGALGAAQVAYYHFQNNERLFIEDSPKNHVYLGPEISDEEIIETLKSNQVNFEVKSEDILIKEVSTALADKKIVGWFNGRMEFGPRALGNRSILASPLFEDMKSHLNLSIKKREGFRPFAPMVREDASGSWFEMDRPSKYMLETFVSNRGAKIPSCVHLDKTARVQTVSILDNPKVYVLLDAFEKITDCPILINTSFNVRGEPIVCSITDALKCFFQTEMDVLVLNNVLIYKSQNPFPNNLLLRQNELVLD